MIKLNQFLAVFQVRFIIILLFTFNLSIAESNMHLDKVEIDLTDQVSLQRGAQLFFNYCYGCHAIKFMRYNSLAKDIGIVDETGNILEEVVQKYLIIAGNKKSTDLISSNLSQKNGEKWFGISPPDLSLVARSRGADWIYTYMRTFYRDPNKVLGVNNLIYPGTAMPHVLWQLQGIQELPDWGTGVELTSAHLKLSEPGVLNQAEYNKAMTDLVNFLVYVSEPIAQQRTYLGIWVLLFISLLILLTYLLKREYWKDVK